MQWNKKSILLNVIVFSEQNRQICKKLNFIPFQLNRGFKNNDI